MIAPHSANTGGSRLATGRIETDYRTIALHVPVRPASELVPIIPPDCLDLVKIDVEGHEFRVLRSLLAGAARLPRHILFEYKPTDFDYGPLAETVDWLQALGYELRTVDDNAFVPALALPEDNLWARLLPEAKLRS